MFFWLFTFINNMIYSLTMIIAGWFMWKHCPKKINSWVGYRSKYSMLNMDTWKFAHENIGKRWYNIGRILLIVTIIVQLLFYGKSEDTLGWLTLCICIIESTILIVSIFPTEVALRKTFTKTGERKE